MEEIERPNSNNYTNQLYCDNGLKSIIDYLPIGFYQTNLNGKVIMANISFSKMVGLNSPDNVIGENILELDVLQNTNRDLFFNNVIKNEESSDFIYELSDTKNSKRTFSERARVIKDNAGQSLYIEGYLQDITEMKQSYKDLQINEAQFRSLFDNSAVGIYRTTPDGKILLANQALVDMLGYSSLEDLQSRNLEKEGFGTPIERLEFKKELDTYGKVIDLKATWMRKDNSVIYIKESAILVKDSEGNTLYYEGTVEDISQLVRTIQDLKQSELKYKTLFNSFPLGIIVTDDSGYIIEVNNIVETIFGKKLYQKHLSKIIDENNYLINSDESILPIEEFPGFITLRDNKVINNEEIGLKSKTGEIKWLSVTASPISLENDSVALTISDITEKKNIFQSLVESETQTRQALKTKDKLISIIAHDLKNPINGFLGLSEYLCQNFNSLTIKEISEITNALYLSSSNLNKLLENLLEWSISQTGNISLFPINFDLYDLIINIMNLLSHQISSKKIEIINNISPHTYCFGDINTINTIIRNLISNAVKFSFKNGKIELNANVIDNHLVISVKDNGIGIIEEQRKLLFKVNDPISSLGTNKEHGTGLGLIICKEFVEMNNGKIWVESEWEKGSTFFVAFPLYKENN